MTQGVRTAHGGAQVDDARCASADVPAAAASHLRGQSMLLQQLLQLPRDRMGMTQQVIWELQCDTLEVVCCYIL